MKTISQNTAILLVNNVGTALLAFILTVILGRGWGEVGLGQYVIIMAWIFPLTIIIDSGLNTLITRNVAADDALSTVYLTHSIRWRWLFGGAIVSSVWLFAPILNDDPTIQWGLRLMAPMILIDNLFGVYTSLWRAKQIMWPIMLLNLAWLSSQIIGATWVWWRGGELWHIFAIIVVADGVQLLVAWGIWRQFHYLPSISNRIVLSLADLLRQMLPFAIGSVLVAIYSRTIILLLEQYTSIAMLGIFAITLRFIEAARLPPHAIFGALFPAMSTWIHRPSVLKLWLWRIGVGLIVYWGTTLLGFGILGNTIILSLYGEPFQQAAVWLIGMGGVLLPLLLRQLLTITLYAQQQEYIINQVYGVGILVQFIVGVVFIPIWGIEGAIFTLGVSEIILLLGLAGRYYWLQHQALITEY